MTGHAAPATGPAAPPPDLVRACLPLWADAADGIDRFELAVTLGAVPDCGADAVHRARLLLLVDRPDDALAVLARHGIDELPAEPTDSWPALVLAAGRAGTDDTAYRWLVTAATESWHGRPVPYLVGVVADRRRDTATADKAWASLFTTYGVRTPVVTARCVATAVAGRDRRNSRAATLRLIAADVLLDRLDPDVDEDPSAALAAGDALRHRGDEAGARLLLRTLTHRRPDVPALAAALHALTPAVAVPRYRARDAVEPWLAPVMLGASVGILATSIVIPAMAIAAAALTAAAVVTAVSAATYAAVQAAFQAINRRHRDRNRAARLRDALAAAGTCRCPDNPALTGPLATAYLQRHLLPVPAPEPVATLLPHSRLGRCPDTGFLWLAAIPPGERNHVLLRGADRS